jgi:hypothetical protein
MPNIQPVQSGENPCTAHPGIVFSPTLISRSIALFFLIHGVLGIQCAPAADFNVANSGATDYVINGANDPTRTRMALR